MDSFANKLRSIQFFDKGDDQNSHSNSSQTLISSYLNGGTFGPYDDIQSMSKFKSRSIWKPPYGSNNLESFLSITDVMLQRSSTRRSFKQNISELEREALKTLSKQRDIVIKPADKGGSIVIQNTMDYMSEANRQLGDKVTYKKLDHNPNKTHLEKIQGVLNRMINNGEITERIAKILIPKKPRTSQLYLLPKIHKNTFPIKGRPIVSANECPTEKISAFVDSFLNPIVKKSKSYIKDTTDFLNMIKGIKLEKNCNYIMGTLDVTSLYTNIPHDEGLEAVSKALEKFRPKNQNPKNESLIQLLRLVLTCNNFQFNDTNYLQLQGTAMGTKMAPSYSCIMMSQLEERMLDAHPLKPKIFKRFIDDCWFIWPHGEEELNKWLVHLNNFHPTLKFTSEWSYKSINFLDTTISINKTEGCLNSDLYIKPTDSNSYLNYNSAHPKHCKDSLVYSQLLRIKRIVDDEEKCKLHFENKLNEFRIKNFPEKVLREAHQRASQKPRETLLETKNKNKNDKIILTTTFRPHTQKLPKLIKENWEMLGRSCTTRNIYNKNFQTSYKRPKNLKDHLVHSKFSYHPEKEKYPKINNTERNRCTNPKCIFCPLIDKSGTLKTERGETQTRKIVTCNSSNLIYCIECQKCKKLYIGETSRKIKLRMSEHMSKIRNKADHELAFHFGRCGGHKNHQIHTNFKIYILDFIAMNPKNKNTERLRKTIENNWIHRLRTQSPKGLNTLDTKYG